LGWLWSVAMPLTSVLVYSYVFGTLMQAEAPIGDPSKLKHFGLFLLSGLVPFAFFSSVTTAGMESLLKSADLIRKVAFPHESLVIAAVLNGLVQFAIELGLLIIIFTFAGTKALLYLPATLVISALLGIFSLGISLILAAWTVRFRDLSHFWIILLQVWFFATPIVYPESLITDRVPTILQQVLSLNPLRPFITAFRNTLYDGTIPSLRLALILVLLATVSLFTGVVVFYSITVNLAEEV
jgi:ABC-type polysaccharide/polyol phosphate export permease